MDSTLENKTWPPSSSANGDNAFYLPTCEFVGRSPAYASCLFKIAEKEAGRNEQHPSHRECCVPIESGRCRALGMRQEEDLQGVALYYVPRQKLASMPLPSRSRFDLALPLMAPAPVARARAAMPPRPQTAAGKSIAPDTPDNGYAAAINAALFDAPMPASGTASILLPAPPSSIPVTSPLPPLATRATTVPPPPIRPPMVPGETPLQYARRCAALESTMKDER